MTIMEEAASPKVVIGIPVYRDKGYLELLLRSIRWYTAYQDYSIAVVDDGSPEAEFREAASAVANSYSAEFIQHETNRGVAASWNTLTRFSKESGASITILLNSDILVVPQWISCAVYALVENEKTGRVGSIYWEPISIPHSNVFEQMTLMHDQLWHTSYRFSINGRHEPHFVNAPSSPKEFFASYQWCAARCLAPNGSGFAFLNSTYDKAGPFEERMLSFHEESSFGTSCGKLGMFSLGIPYPRTYHAGSQTFIQNPEVNPSQRFQDSKKVFCEIWGVPEDRQVHGHDYFAYVNELYLDTIPKTAVKCLVPSGDQEEYNGHIVNALVPVEYVL